MLERGLIPFAGHQIVGAVLVDDRLRRFNGGMPRVGADRLAVELVAAAQQLPGGRTSRRAWLARRLRRVRHGAGGQHVPVQMFQDGLFGGGEAFAFGARHPGSAKISPGCSEQSVNPFGDKGGRGGKAAAYEFPLQRQIVGKHDGGGRKPAVVAECARPRAQRAGGR